MTEPTNKEKGQRASIAAILHSTDFPAIESSHDEKLIDLLTNLRHACDMHGFDFGKLDKMAYNHYLAEFGADKNIQN